MNIALQQFLMTEPDGTLETIATQFDTTLFINQEGVAMFKIFLGRDEHRQLLPEQLLAFRRLAQQLNKE